MKFFAILYMFQLSHELYVAREAWLAKKLNLDIY